jgi:FkbM family methyltransferase
LVCLRKWGSDPATFGEVFLDGVYRPVLENVRRCRTLIDVGANVGLASIYFCAHFGCRCFCVESNPNTFRILQRNLAGVGAQLLHAGVWNSETMLTADCRDARYSMSTVHATSHGEVQGLPMQEVIRRSGFSTVDLLKLDIEGAEREVFQGDLSWLEGVQAIAIEFHEASRRETSFDEVMRERSFRVIEGGHTTIAIRD